MRSGEMVVSGRKLARNLCWIFLIGSDSIELSKTTYFVRKNQSRI